jgi:hypothetical protein
MRTHAQAVAEVGEYIDLHMPRITFERCLVWDVTKPGPTGYATLGIGGRHGPRKAVHRLAYEWRYGPIPEDHQIHHGCNRPLCVNPLHLLAVTIAEHRRLDNLGVDNNGGGKLTEEQVMEIYNDPRSQRVIGRDYGVTHSQVGLIKRGKQWTHVTNHTPAQDRASR